MGNLKPRPAKEWLALARQVEQALLGQLSIDMAPTDPLVADIVAKVRERRPKAQHPKQVEDGPISVYPDRIEVEQGREAGTVHVGNEFWNRLEIDDVLQRAGLSERERLLTRVMTLNRLISPASEHAMPDWVNRTALQDLLGVDLSQLNDDTLYRNLDQLWPRRGEIEKGLVEKERDLFNLDTTIYLYDLTSTYFEGKCEGNPMALRGYSRDKRPDCKQVVVGLVVNRDGFPIAHEVFKGNEKDEKTVTPMLEVLEARVGKKEGATVVVDRGMAYEEDLEAIRGAGYHYIVATRQSERNKWLDEFETDGWREVVREPSPNNPAQKKTKVRVKEGECGDTYVLCLSEERAAKDRAIREKHEARLLIDLGKLAKRVEAGKLKAEDKIYERIGRLKERYPRVARYYTIGLEDGKVYWEENKEKKAIAESLDGGYLLRTDRKDIDAEEIWRVYSLLTRAESAFRAMKSPLAERPIFHQLKNRVETHIFLCVLAYHLLVAIEKTLQDRGHYTSWATVRETLSNHQIVTVVLPTSDGRSCGLGRLPNRILSILLSMRR
ncbi:MAG: IS1634 family transposase [Firmicutes bacterium]|nr:IS1634 family transposase [Bacillota bacterium]